jgi:hypothetical protein
VESDIDFLVEHEAFPYKTGKFNLENGYERFVNAIPVLMTGMRLNLCPNIWSMKRSRLMNNGRTLIGCSFIMWSGIGIFGWSWFPR